MNGIEAVTILLCLGLCIGQLTTAYWVSRIISVIARTLDEDKRVRDAQMRNFMGWLAEVASAVKSIHAIAADFSKRSDNRNGTIAPEPTATRSPEETPPTVRHPRKSEAGLTQNDRANSQGDRLSDAETEIWTGPPSGHTLLGVGAAEVPAATSPSETPNP